ncbi:NAD-dependent epimerase/dehydratase family protein [Microbulbifer agarilyticus]|uniref:NAD-dependent epimerase/dehydratase family protein n=1 Tax=Microbulbifer agarilyticus TaxID=260552 RepID=UPI001CD1F3D4|nr:NAD-dependent epimerase/dehydratase family protein [Microbulbifer agarilyticus]MCA0901410.1 NAD-dependent epimerase/dehydratase family protein [Microbulbifer agarilyticus]
MITKNRPVCVLGAGGFLGSAICEALSRNGVPWVGVSTSKQGGNLVQLADGDAQALARVLSSSDIVINASGRLKPLDFESNPAGALSDYWDAQQYFSEAYKASGIKYIVHISSAGTVYGESISGIPHSEEDCLNPISWYGRAKVLEEMWYENLCRRKGVKYLCVRVSNPFGNTRMTNHGFIDVFLHRILNKESVSVYKDVDPARDFIHAGDMAETIYNLIAQNNDGCYNVGSGVSIRLSEVVEFACSKVVESIPVLKELEHKGFDVVNSSIDISKVKEIGALSSNISVFDYIEDFLERYKVPCRK